MPTSPRRAHIVWLLGLLRLYNFPRGFFAYQVPRSSAAPRAGVRVPSIPTAAHAHTAQRAPCGVERSRAR
eukprot:COSAG03_NODE_19586_length_334_cov_0.387234_1_plen_69_part_10